MFEPVEEVQESSVTVQVTSVKFALSSKKANDKKVPTGSNLLAERDKKGRLQEENDEDDVTPETITHVEDRKVKGTKPEPKTGPMVIPMIVTNDWRAERLKEQVVKIEETTVSVSVEAVVANGADVNVVDDLAARAKAALLKEAKGLDAESSEGTSLAVPLLLANRVPAGFETDDKLDVSLRPDEVDADYESVPIEEFGLALLRGMGWKEGDPIGNSNKQLVKAKIPELRPKGLGLGADRSRANKLAKGPAGQPSSSTSGDAKEDALSLKKGSYVKIVTGPHRESYGKVESFDEDNARIVIRLAIGNTAVTVSQFGVEVVSLKDYERDSKCINKSKYDRFKKEQESQYANHVIEDDPLAVSDDLLQKNKSKSKKRKRDRSRSASPVEKKKFDKSNQPPWVRADLRVRFVDKKYKNGRYYNTKMSVFDVVSKENCSLRDEKGRIIDGISESWLETVIPKSDDQPVMVLRGEDRGEVGKIVDRDRKRQRASVQLSRTQDIVTVSYDDVCEFCGDATIFLD